MIEEEAPPPPPDSPEDDWIELEVSPSSSLSRSDKFRRTIRRKSFNTQHLSCPLTTGSAVFTETREANFLDDDSSEQEENSSLHAHFEELLLSILDLSLEVS